MVYYYCNGFELHFINFMPPRSFVNSFLHVQPDIKPIPPTFDVYKCDNSISISVNNLIVDQFQSNNWIAALLQSSKKHFLQYNSSEIILFHASCIMDSDTIYIFYGKSHSGKSTVGYLLCQSGMYTFISDEVLMYHTQESTINPSFNPIQLRTDICQCNITRDAWNHNDIALFRPANRLLTPVSIRDYKIMFCNIKYVPSSNTIVSSQDSSSSLRLLLSSIYNSPQMPISGLSNLLNHTYKSFSIQYNGDISELIDQIDHYRRG